MKLSQGKKFLNSLFFGQKSQLAEKMLIPKLDGRGRI
jgi:hypothetical protein